LASGGGRAELPIEVADGPVHPAHSRTAVADGRLGR
jgi:hypothetical protein